MDPHSVEICCRITQRFNIFLIVFGRPKTKRTVNSNNNNNSLLLLISECICRKKWTKLHFVLGLSFFFLLHMI